MKLYGLIGFPLFHSFSEDYFNNKFIKENIADSIYKLFPLEDISELPDLIKNEPELIGLNITIPYKEKVLKYIDKLDETAEKIGAVNTIKILRPLTSDLIPYTCKLLGYNTDIYGFKKSIEPLLTRYDIRYTIDDLNLISKIVNPKSLKALILGTGRGAAKAIAYALNQLNISYTFVSRQTNPGKTSELRTPNSELSYKNIDKNVLESHLIIINTTPLGMYPDINNKPDIPYEFITEHHLAIDLIYNPVETLFLKQCKSRHAIIQNGLLMLHLQAEKSWEIWNSLPFLNM